MNLGAGRLAALMRDPDFGGLTFNGKVFERAYLTEIARLDSIEAEAEAESRKVVRQLEDNQISDARRDELEELYGLLINNRRNALLLKSAEMRKIGLNLPITYSIRSNVSDLENRVAAKLFGGDRDEREELLRDIAESNESRIAALAAYEENEHE